MKQSELQIGELFLLGFDNASISVVQQFHDRFGLGGVIIFSRNVESSQSVGDLVSSIRAVTDPSLLVAVDQEGGRVCRIADSDFPVFPSPSYYGLRNDLAGAKHACSVTARRLRSAGINFNLNPVADVFAEPGSTLLRDRSYSSNTESVCGYVHSAVEAQTSERVASCAKHFPGLGGSTVDPHQKMAVSGRSTEFFRTRLFPPFEAAISAGCSAIMTTHLAVQSLDPFYPATFSNNIVSGILRERIAFDGLIISDDLDMGAVISENDSALHALKAGHDMVLICQSMDRQLATAERIVQALANETLDAAEVAAKIERVRKVKYDFAVD